MQNKDLKIIFWGTSSFAVPALQKLIENGYDIPAVFTGQGPIKSLAQEHGIKIFQPKSLKDDQVFGEFRDLGPDICIIAAYGKIIPQKYLEIPKHGFVNIHPSLLPKYRGPSPIQAAILNGDEETGVAITIVDKEMDHGSILKIEEIKIKKDAYYKGLEKELADIGARMLIEVLPEYINGKITPQEQDHPKATFTKMIKKEDAKIDWNRPAEIIYNQIRAFHSEPVAWTIWSARPGNNKILNIKQAEISCSASQGEQPGIVMNVDNKIAVATGKCYLILKTIQLEGGKEMDAKDFLNGHPDFLNSKLGS